jgi:hypothetical protein
VIFQCNALENTCAKKEKPPEGGFCCSAQGAVSDQAVSP